jgi:integral membrane sensor domain MASE1
MAFLFLHRGGRVWWVWVVSGFLGKWGGREGEVEQEKEF